MEYFVSWLAGVITITIFLYFWVYKHVKQNKPWVKNKGIRFLLLLITIWAFLGAFILTENKEINDVIKIIGIIFPMLFYNLLFNWGNNSKGN